MITLKFTEIAVSLIFQFGLPVSEVLNGGVALTVDG